ncbi:hypothetical protein [Hungatella hathewayi]|uniref:hypothetical protein n=1 Tax=Hungatella hathewayi TaxID=154046 RepID=UPI003566DD50
MEKREWVEHNACRFCKGSHMHSCGHISCLPAVYEAGEYYEKYKDVIENENGIEKYQ